MIPAKTFVTMELFNISEGFPRFKRAEAFLKAEQIRERRDCFCGRYMSMKRLENKSLFQHLDKTIASVLFEENTYPWEVLPKISDFILEIGMLLSKDEYDEIQENVWVAKSAVVAPTAYIKGPALIGPGAEIRHCAFIRGNAIVGENAVVGNSTELKNVILFDKVQVSFHFLYH